MKKIIIAVAALALMAGSAYAADWNFYGSARVSTFWSDADTDNGPDDDTQFDEGVQSNSRIGAKVKVSDELTGRFEYGTGVNVRLLYGEWNFGAGKLLVGQDYVPLNQCGSNQVYLSDGDLEGYGGEMFGGRHAQIKLTFGDFQIAFVENNTNYMADKAATAYSAFAAYQEADADVDVIMPAIEVKYELSGENWTVSLAGGYQTFDVDNGAVDDDVTSWGLGIDASVKMGAFYGGAGVNGGTNVGNLWLIDVTGFDVDDSAIGAGYAYVDGGDIIDNDAIGARIYLGYTFNEMFAVEIGYGYQQTEYDEDIAGTDEYESQSYYINFPITLAPGVVVTPEIGVVDYTVDDSAQVQDDITYFGAKWQINF